MNMHLEMEDYYNYKSVNSEKPSFGAFWIANTITSTILGLRNRSLQRMASEQNDDFRMEMERAKNITEDRKIQEEIAFKRRLMGLSRQHRQEETRNSFNNQLKVIELEFYLKYCWPLDPNLPFVVLRELKNSERSGITDPRLNVILMHPQLLPITRYGMANNDETEMFERLEYSFGTEVVPDIGDINFRKDAALTDGRTAEDCSGNNASIMNIHFLMSQIPTLVISPYYNEGMMNINGAIWESQASRPMIRPLLSFDYNPVEAATNEGYREQKMDLLYAVVSVITGWVRDSFMLFTQGKAPTMSTWLNLDCHKKIKQLAEENKGLQCFIKQEIKNTLAAMDEKKSPHLLDFYHVEDIRAMKKQLESINF